MWISWDFIIWFFTIFQSGFSIAIFWCLPSWPKSTIAWHLASIQDVKLSGWSISGVKVLIFSRSFGSIASNDQRNTSISRSFPHFLGISWIILIAQGPLTPATTPREAAEATSGWCFCYRNSTVNHTFYDMIWYFVGFSMIYIYIYTRVYII